MHIKKNFLDNIFHIAMDIKDKMKDSARARMDLIECCRRSELHLRDRENGQFSKPKTMFAFTSDQR